MSDPFKYIVKPPPKGTWKVQSLLGSPTKVFTSLVKGVHTPDTYTKQEGSLTVERECVSGFNALVNQESTGDSKWVDINDIRKRGLSHAYYDSDPTYLPDGETP